MTTHRLDAVRTRDTGTPEERAGSSPGEEMRARRGGEHDSGYPRAIGVVRLHRHARRHLTRDVLKEVAIAVSAFIIYFGVRGLTEGNVSLAVSNAHDILRFERWLGIDIESNVQEVVIGSPRLVDVANWVYIWGHWPVIATVAAWLLLTRPRDYRLIRNAILISGGIGLIIFATFPVAPPRLLDINLVDTVTERSHAYRVLQPKAFVNQYAAVPSLHFGWDLLMGISLVRFGSRTWIRVAGFILPFAMGFAVIATANHFIVDAVAGGALALFALGIAWILERRWRRAELAAQHLAV